MSRDHLLVLTDVVLHPLTIGVRPLAVTRPVGDQTVLPRVGVVWVTGNPVSVRERVPRGQPLEGPLFLQVGSTQPVYSLRTWKKTCFILNVSIRCHLEKKILDSSSLSISLSTSPGSILEFHQTINYLTKSTFEWFKRIM